MTPEETTTTNRNQTAGEKDKCVHNLHTEETTNRPRQCRTEGMPNLSSRLTIKQLSNSETFVTFADAR